MKNNKSKIITLLVMLIAILLLCCCTVEKNVEITPDPLDIPVYNEKESSGNFGFLNSPGVNDYKDDLGIEFIRYGAKWGKIQNETDVKNGIFRWVEYEEENNLEITKNSMILISLLGTPVEEAGSYLPSEESVSYTQERYLLFVEELVNRYKDKTKFFQVENEPKPYLKNYSDFLIITAEKIKSICSECKVIMAGTFGYQTSDEFKFNREIRPILEELNGKHVDVFDIHWFGSYDDTHLKNKLTYIKRALKETGFENKPIWITETGTYTNQPERSIFQSETEQAESLIKRYVIAFSNDIEKVCWAWGLMEGYQGNDTFFDHTGLIYDGRFSGDKGYGVKKLSYYTYKLMTKKLNGFDIKNIETIKENDNGIYVVKFTNKETGKQVLVAWSDSGSSSINLSLLGISNAKLTKAVPDFDSGKTIEDENVQFDNMFEETTTYNSIQLDDVPVYIE